MLVVPCRHCVDVQIVMGDDAAETAETAGQPLSTKKEVKKAGLLTRSDQKRQDCGEHGCASNECEVLAASEISYSR